MTNINNVNLTSNSLSFLNSLSNTEYPTLVTYREHLSKYTPLKTLSELTVLDICAHNAKSRQEMVNYLETTWLIRSSIFSLLEFESRPTESQDLEDLENYISDLKDSALSNAQRIEKLIQNAIKKHGRKISDFDASLNLINICLKLSAMNIQKMREA